MASKSNGACRRVTDVSDCRQHVRAGAEKRKKNNFFLPKHPFLDAADRVQASINQLEPEIRPGTFRRRPTRNSNRTDGRPAGSDAVAVVSCDAIVRR
jgi:hypothetical protein